MAEQLRKWRRLILSRISEVFIMSLNVHFRTMGGMPTWQPSYRAKMTRR
jgi:hypothetical protein